MLNRNFSYSYEELERYEKRAILLAQKVAAQLTLDEADALLMHPYRRLRGKSSRAYQECFVLLNHAETKGVSYGYKLNARVLRQAIAAKLQPTFKYRFLSFFKRIMSTSFFSDIQSLFGMSAPSGYIQSRLADKIF